MSKKYKLLEKDVIELGDKKLHRIKALKNFEVENSKPEQLNNLPEKGLSELDNGHYFWGTKQMVEDFKKDTGWRIY